MHYDLIVNSTWSHSFVGIEVKLRLHPPICVATALRGAWAEHERSMKKRNRHCVVCYTRRFISQSSLRHESVTQIGVCKRSLTHADLSRNDQLRHKLVTQIGVCKRSLNSGSIYTSDERAYKPWNLYALELNLVQIRVCLELNQILKIDRSRV